MERVKSNVQKSPKCCRTKKFLRIFETGPLFLFLFLDCGCVPEGCKNESLICDPQTGQCDCKCAIEGLKCDVCIDMHYNWPHCEDYSKILYNLHISNTLLIL